MSGIQNIDFSHKISSNPNIRSSSQPMNSSWNQNWSRFLGWAGAISVLVFTAGLLAGLKIAELRSFEKNLVKYPADTNFSNTVETKSPKETSKQSQAEKPAVATASLIIRIGSFSAGRAGELARSLNQLPELESISFYACAGNDDLNPDRSQVFALPIEGSKLQRLFAGCYRTQEDALKALKALHNTGVASLTDSKVYEITD